MCSAEYGWKLAHPDGSAFNIGKPGSAANLALQLLLPDLSAAEREAAIGQALGHSTEEKDLKSPNKLKATSVI